MLKFPRHAKRVATLHCKILTKRACHLCRCTVDDKRTCQTPGAYGRVTAAIVTDESYSTIDLDFAIDVWVQLVADCYRWRLIMWYFSLFTIIHTY